MQRFNWSNLGHFLKSDIIAFQILIIFHMTVSLHGISLFPSFSESVQTLSFIVDPGKPPSVSPSTQAR